MAQDVQKGSEYHNIGETWDQNERKRAGGEPPRKKDDNNTGTTISTDLDRAIKEEAAQYDHENKEDRVMGGERASVNDEPER
ncbi:hypothetical protein OCK74_11355 [Chitinophagaceae bacterium LB-8]|uniref:Uncharacterized protein n=1 Tax=Paraflavisolibacter caeni TaxID=2982496 RepID=A0A9X2XVP8_9BACT|nr:hypothetical protein [Paraflavisolibacter caeni]MCU7549715.1 hypothetical protein [Paraflavisolibacter caeni]